MSVTRERILKNLAAVLLGGIGASLVAYVIFSVALGVQWIAYGQIGPSIAKAIDGVDAARRVVAVPVVVLCAGLGWWFLGRRQSTASLASAVSDPSADFDAPRTIMDSLLQITVISVGISAGREGAPRQAAAAVANGAARALNLVWEDRLLILGAGSGAGLAVVYGTPWAAIPFALTATIGRWTWRGIVYSASMAWIACALTLPLHHLRPAFPVQHVPFDHALAIYAWALASIPVCAFGGYLMEHLCISQWVVAMRRDVSLILAAQMAGIGLLTAACGLVIPALLANGSATVARLTFQDLPGDHLTFTACCVFLAVKPLLTALSFRFRMLGGLLMPSASVGAALGGAVASGMALCGMPLGNATGAVFAAMGAASFLAVMQHSALFGVLFIIELTWMPAWIWPAVVVACAGAHFFRVGASRIRNRR